MRLIPKDEGFFELFDALAERLTLAAALLNELFTDPTRLDHLAGQIKELEHQADEVTHEVVVRLDRSFVTPLDREDIHALATTLDNVVDLVNGTARRAQMFHIGDCREPAMQMTAVLVRASELIRQAVHNVRDPQQVARISREIKQLEQEGDILYFSAVGALFAGKPQDALEVVKWKELYDNIEYAIDESEDVLNVLESISIKNS
ncbi:phosphate transport regulator [Gemmatimonadota bacterium]|nr:phosphate transport regulator [Gemmatimonadota bacterium]